MLIGRYVQDTDMHQSHLFWYEMNANLYAFSMAVMHWICGHVHLRHIVAVDHHRLVDWAVEFTEELLKLDTLCSCIGDGSKFGLST